MARLTLAALVVSLGAVVSSKPSLRDPGVIEDSMGVVGDWHADDGDLFFTLQGDSHSQVVRTDRAGIEALRDVLQASLDTGNSLRIDVHLDGAYYAWWDHEPHYWVKSIEYQGRTYGPFEPRLRRSWRRMPEAQAALLRAIAFDNASRNDQAVKALAGADFSALPADLRALALRTRANASEDMAYPPGTVINADSDLLLARAVRDYREAARLAPDDPKPLLRQANALLPLGGYEEALRLLTEVGKRWPQERFVATIRRAAAHRLRGDHHASLRALEEIRPAPGETAGMMYHYHRAWTLTKLERYQEAVHEIGLGLQTQPDYVWANGRRACALARLGRLDEAIADLQLVMDELENMPEQAEDGGLSYLLARTREQLRALEAARVSAPRQPTGVACHEEADNPHYSRRERSPVLADL